MSTRKSRISFVGNKEKKNTHTNKQTKTRQDRRGEFGVGRAIDWVYLDQLKRDEIGGQKRILLRTVNRDFDWQ